MKKVLVVLGEKLEKNGDLTNECLERIYHHIHICNNYDLIVFSGKGNHKQYIESIQMGLYCNVTGLKEYVFEVKSMDTISNIIESYFCILNNTVNEEFTADILSSDYHKEKIQFILDYFRLNKYFSIITCETVNKLKSKTMILRNRKVIDYYKKNLLTQYEVDTLNDGLRFSYSKFFPGREKDKYEIELTKDLEMSGLLKYD